ncbi:MAG: MraY family glycosyltransferase [Bacteroidota bacterium]
MIELLVLVAIPLTAFTSAYHLIPAIIKVAQEKALFDLPDARKQHAQPTPPMGGIAIFVSFFLAFAIWADPAELLYLKYPFIGIVLLFFMGLKDDLLEMKASHKFVIQIFIATLVAGGGLRIEHLHGLFSIYELGIFSQYTITILFIVGFVNAFNLIDGIDGLSGGLGMIASLVLGIMFISLNLWVYAALSLALAGSLLGFLWFNFAPAKIFMGDAGSLVVGFLIALLSISFLNFSAPLSAFSSFNSFGPALIFALLMVPLVDTLQVMFSRVIQGRSPFSPDRNHVHHHLIRMGFSHQEASLRLYAVSLAAVGLVILGNVLDLPQSIILGVLVSLSIAGVYFLHLKSQQAEKPRATPQTSLPSWTKFFQTINQYLF